MNSTKTFSFNSIKNFDKHIAQSIPNYDLLFDSIVSLAPYFLYPQSAIIDLGCSTGKLLETIPYDGRKIGYDISDNLLPQSQGRTSYSLRDITGITQFVDATLILSIFTLQFIDRSKRQELLDKIYASLVDGGAFIWAEKVHADSAYWEQTLTSAHYDYKQKSFTAQEILDKERDLRTMMRLQTSKENQDMAWKAGFRNSALLWKFFNFECYVYVKESI